MKRFIKKPFWSAAALFLIVLVVIISFYSFWGSYKEPTYEAERVLRYGFTVTNPTSSHLENTGFWVYAPYAQTSTQKRISLNSSYSYEVNTDKFGNEKLVFTFDLPPFGSKEIWIESKLALTDKPNRFPDEAQVRTAGIVKYAESDSNEIVEQAKNLKTGGVENNIKAIYNWVRKHITYSGYIKDDRGALYALKAGQGDCTEYAYLTASLAQAQNIPARVVAGFVAPANKVLQPADYHNWTELTVDDAWHVVDSQKEVMFSEPSRYIAMRILEGVASKNDDNSQRFFAALNGATVIMNTSQAPEI